MSVDDPARTLQEPSPDAVTLPRARIESRLEMARTALADPSSAPPRVDVAPAPLDEQRPGERYVARATLGEGGMGEVRLCRDARIGRDVAMKVIRAGAGSRSDLRARFEREARVQGQLEHPAIVPVYDLGIGADGAAFFTMKRIRGKTFDEIVEGLRAKDAEITAQYTLRKLLVAFAQVCNALAFAHARGVLHRDLKPANVMLGDFGEVYVLDWGLAKLVEPTKDEGPASSRASSRALAAADDTGGMAPIQDASSLAAAATATGAIMGTPGYMAPEQIRADAELDARVDVYALGAILFELLALEPLHARTTPEAVLLSTLGGIDARPSQRAPDRETPPELEAIVVRATALEREDRHPTARALLEEVERYLDGDRDLARRRELAMAHAERAKEAANRGQNAIDGVEARREAIREVSRALAFDPAHPEAMATMLRLLVEVPEKMPAEVEQDYERSLLLRRRASERVGSWGYLAWLCLAASLLVMGVRTWSWAIAFVVAVVASYVITRVVASGRVGDDRPWAVPAFLFSSFACIASGMIFGPFIMLPGLLATNTLFFVMEIDDKKRRALFIVGAALAFVVPLALEWLGVLPPSYAFRDGTIALLPRVASFPPGPTLVVLVVSSLSMVLLPPLLVARIGDEMRHADRKLHVHLWHLRQFIPDEARGAAKMPDPEPMAPLCGVHQAARLTRRA